jgi:starch synthase (maltosyl-transferring)
MEGDNLILVVVNLDPFKAIETMVHWNLSALGLEDKSFEVTDLLDQAKYNWSRDTFIRLDPSRPMGRVAHIARVKK